MAGVCDDLSLFCDETRFFDSLLFADIKCRRETTFTGFVPSPSTLHVGGSGMLTTKKDCLQQYLFTDFSLTPSSSDYN